MKRKQLNHPRLYLKIINRKNNDLIVEYKDNIFNEQGLRKHKKCKINLTDLYNILSDDSEEQTEEIKKSEKTKESLEAKEEVTEAEKFSALVRCEKLVLAIEKQYDCLILVQRQHIVFYSEYFFQIETQGVRI